MPTRTATIHPTAVVGPGVSLGTDVTIGPYAVLLGPLRVGDRVTIGGGSQIGAPPEISTSRQNVAWEGDLDHFGVVIEDDTLVRELVVIHQGSHRPTTVGAGCLLFNRCYLAHDVQVGAGTTISAGVSVGGHCTIREGSNLGMNVTVHQRRQIGHRAMVGMSAAVTHDVPPYAKAFGVPVRVHGANVVGMERAGFSQAQVASVVGAYAGSAGGAGFGALDLLASEGGEGGVGVGLGEGGVGVGELAEALAWWRDLPDRRPAPVA